VTSTTAALPPTENGVAPSPITGFNPSIVGFRVFASSGAMHLVSTAWNQFCPYSNGGSVTDLAKKAGVTRRTIHQWIE